MGSQRRKGRCIENWNKRLSPQRALRTQRGLFLKQKATTTKGNKRGQAFLIVVIGENILTQRRKGANVKNRRREDGEGDPVNRGQERQEKGLSIEILGPFPIPEQFCEFLIRHNINTFVGFPHPFFKTNDDQRFYLREIFFKIDKSTDIPGGDF